MHEQVVLCLPLKQYLRIQFQRLPGWQMDSPSDMLQAEQAWAQACADGAEKVKVFCGIPIDVGTTNMK